MNLPECDNNGHVFGGNGGYKIVELSHGQG